MPISRYRNIPVISEKGSSQYYESIDQIDPKKLEEIPSIKIRLTKFDRLDILAFNHLGSGEYWWVLALMNDLDWMYGFEEGSILKIPINVDDVLKLT